MSLKLLTDACEEANQQRLEHETPLNLLFILERDFVKDTLLTTLKKPYQTFTSLMYCTNFLDTFSSRFPTTKGKKQAKCSKE